MSWSTDRNYCLPRSKFNLHVTNNYLKASAEKILRNTKIFEFLQFLCVVFVIHEINLHSRQLRDGKLQLHVLWNVNHESGRLAILPHKTQGFVKSFWSSDWIPKQKYIINIILSLASTLINTKKNGRVWLVIGVFRGSIHSRGIAARQTEAHSLPCGGHTVVFLPWWAPVQKTTVEAPLGCETTLDTNL